MGTRNLTAVMLNGEYKVAQYGQWDGYPDGQGLRCLEFLRDKCDIDAFTNAVKSASFYATEEIDALLQGYGVDEDGYITMVDYKRFSNDYPELSRDTGAGILEIIQEKRGGVRLWNNIDFAADSLFCEWAWVIDLDARSFEGYAGLNTTPLTPDDRFFFLADQERKGYSGVKLVAKWSLDQLPTDKEFLAAFEEDET